MMLKSLDHEVTLSCDGQDALEKIQANTFDVLITDNKMPRLSGVQLIEILREMNNPLKIIMITGFASQLNAEKKPLFDGLLIKPFRAKDILECLRNLGFQQASTPG